MKIAAENEDGDRQEIERYMARVCLCGRPRSEHFYGYEQQEKTKRTPRGLVATQIMGGSCEHFIDAIERRFGIEEILPVKPGFSVSGISLGVSRRRRS